MIISNILILNKSPLNRNNHNRSQIKNYLKSHYDILVLKCHSILKFKIEEQHSNHSTDYLQLKEAVWFFALTNTNDFLHDCIL